MKTLFLKATTIAATSYVPASPKDAALLARIDTTLGDAGEIAALVKGCYLAGIAVTFLPWAGHEHTRPAEETDNG